MFARLFPSQTQNPKTTVPERKDTEETQNQVSSNVKDGQTPALIEAIKKNNQQEFSRLLNLKTDPSGKKFIDEIDAEYGGSPLYWAAAYGHVHFITPLIKAGAAVNKPDKDGRTPVYIAAQNGHAAVIAALHALGANVNTLRDGGCTPVYIAAQQGQASTIAALHAAGANVNTPQKDGATPVYIAAQFGQTAAIAALHAAGANVNTPRNDGSTPVYIAAQFGQTAAIAALHAAGANVNTPMPSGATPVCVAAANGHASVIASLHAAGANVNTPNANGATPVCVAAFKGHTQAIAALHAAGANVNTPRNDGSTPVYIAAQFGQAAAIAALHAAGANVKTPENQYGTTPVYIAAFNGQASAIVALDAAGANVNTPSKLGETPVHIAARNGHGEAIRALKAAGAYINMPTTYGCTPVFIAAENGHASAIAALLEVDADASVKTPFGTALEQARQGKEPGHPEIVRLLEAHFKQYPNGIKSVPAIVRLLEARFKQYPNEIKPVPAKAVDKDKAVAQKLTSASVSPSPGSEVKTTHGSPTEPKKPTQAPLTPTLKDASPSNAKPSNANPFISYQINYTELDFGRELGKGSFGIVYQGTWRKHTEVAIKQLLSDNVSPEAKAEFETESQVMARLHSPNIVQFYGYCLSPRRCLVMEYMPNGSLFSVLKTKQPLDWSARARIAIDMARGLAFLHQEHIVHRDIKSLNVLLNESYGAKLSDFGLSRVKTETKSQSMASQTSKDAFGTLAWMAPELFERRATYTQKSDIYSLGITLWELASRKIPFADAGNPALIPSWVSKGEREGIPQDCPQKLASLITACWEGSPDKRPDADTVVDYLKSEQTNFAQFLPLFSTHQSSEHQVNLHLPAGNGFCLETGYQNNPQARPAVPKPAVLEGKKPPT